MALKTTTKMLYRRPNTVRSPLHWEPRSFRWTWFSLCAALVVTTAFAAPTDLDLTFDPDGAGPLPGGKLLTDFGNSADSGFSVALQADGKILLGGTRSTDYGDFALARYHPDGALDISFDGDGKLSTDFGGRNEVGQSVVLQADGKILLGGYSKPGGNQHFALARYNSDGTLDSAFDGDGKLITAFGLLSTAHSVVALPDGKIILGGTSQSPITGSYNFALARYSPGGTLDFHFDGDGLVTTEMGGHDTGFSVAIQSDGKILLAGGRYVGKYDFALARYNADGSLDTSFSGDGKLTTDFGVGSTAYSVALQADGKILLGGSLRTSPGNNDYDFALARYHPNGTLDTSFNGDGRATTNLGVSSSGGSGAHSVAVQSDGKILLGGNSYINNRSYFTVVRYHPDGTLDASFDGDGILTTAVGSNTAFGRSMVLQADGKIVLGGSGYSNNTFDFALVRYLGEGPSTPVDTLPPGCVVGTVVSSGGRVYLLVTVTDGESGVAQVQLTANSSNCKLEWDGPGGTVTTAIGGTIAIIPAAASATVRAVKLNSSQKARVELRVTDAAGNSIVCDPVIANLKIKKGGKLTRTFTRLPEHEHYLSLQNGSPGIAAARLWVNGKLVSSGPLSDRQVVSLDLRQWMRRGNRNTVRITAAGPVGSGAVLLIGDASLAGGGHSHHSQSPRLNIEFSR